MNATLNKLLLLTLFFSTIISCNEPTPTEPPQNLKPKYIFLFIGDGMGSNHVSLAEAYLASIQGQIGMSNLTMTNFSYFGLCTTYAKNSNITDSGAAGAAIACGEKADNGVISYFPLLAEDQQPSSIAELAYNNDFKVGIITTVSIDHATPASFYAVNESRSNYYEIGLELPASNYEFFGGGFKYPTGSAQDQTSLYTISQESGYFVTDDITSISALNAENDKVILSNSIDSGGGDMPYAIDRDIQGGYSLDQVVETAINFLDNETGFFMMVEGGRIDWAGHDNDAATIVGDVLDFDNAILEAYEFYMEHPFETLIIVTADHETGGLSLGNNQGGYSGSYESLELQACSMGYFSWLVSEYKDSQGEYHIEEVMQLAQDNFFTEPVELTESEYNKVLDAFGYYFYGSTSMPEEDLYEIYGANNPVAVSFTNIINSRSSASFTTWSHTGTRVPVYAIGQKSELFSGGMDNTDFHRIICEIMEW